MLLRGAVDIVIGNALVLPSQPRDHHYEEGRRAAEQDYTVYSLDRDDHRLYDR